MNNSLKLITNTRKHEETEPEPAAAYIGLDKRARAELLGLQHDNQLKKIEILFEKGFNTRQIRLASKL